MRARHAVRYAGGQATLRDDVGVTRLLSRAWEARSRVQLRIKKRLCFAGCAHACCRCRNMYKLLWLPSIASQIAVCSAPLRSAVRSTRKYCRLSATSNGKRVQLTAARPFGAPDTLTVNAIPCDRIRVNSLHFYRHSSVRSICILGSRSGRAESIRSHGLRSFDRRPDSPAVARTATPSHEPKRDHVRSCSHVSHRSRAAGGVAGVPEPAKIARIDGRTDGRPHTLGARKLG